MILRFWGVRAQVATPGADFIKYGGNTPCIEIRNSDNEILILEAGTGIRSLGGFLMQNDFKNGPLDLCILISDTRWDHTQGFPFFTPCFIPSSQINWYGPSTQKGNLSSYVGSSMTYSYFPIRLDELRSNQSFFDLDEGSYKFKNYKIESIFLPTTHLSMGYKIETDDKKLVYFPGYDYQKLRENKDVMERFIDFCKDVDVLIHETYFESENSDYEKEWERCSFDQALELAKLSNVKRILFHGYQPGFTDEKIDNIINHYLDIGEADSNFEAEIIPTKEELDIRI